MSSSSSEEEMDEAFRESAGCDYITRMVAVPSKSKTKKSSGRNVHQPEVDISVAPESSTVVDDGADKVGETGFEKFLAKRLASRLDENIKIVERKNKSFLSDGTPPGCGIQLFSGSPRVSELIEPTYEQTVSPRKRQVASVENVDYSERAEEAAVSHQWVKDPSNTAFWKDSKKPRVMSAKVVKKMSNGVLECIPFFDG